MRTVPVVRGYVSKSRIRRKQNQRIFGKLSIKGYSGSYRGFSFKCSSRKTCLLFSKKERKEASCFCRTGMVLGVLHSYGGLTFSLFGFFYQVSQLKTSIYIVKLFSIYPTSNK